MFEASFSIIHSLIIKTKIDIYIAFLNICLTLLPKHIHHYELFEIFQITMQHAQQEVATYL